VVGLSIGHDDSLEYLLDQKIKERRLPVIAEENVLQDRMAATLQVLAGKS